MFSNNSASDKARRDKFDPLDQNFSDISINEGNHIIVKHKSPRQTGGCSNHTGITNTDENA